MCSMTPDIFYNSYQYKIDFIDQESSLLEYELLKSVSLLLCVPCLVYYWCSTKRHWVNPDTPRVPPVCPPQDADHPFRGQEGAPEALGWPQWPGGEQVLRRRTRRSPSHTSLRWPLSPRAVSPPCPHASPRHPPITSVCRSPCGLACSWAHATHGLS